MQFTFIGNSANLVFFRRAVAQVGLDGRATLVYGETGATESLAFDELLGLAETAELLVNASGHLGLPALKHRFRPKGLEALARHGWQLLDPAASPRR